MKIPRTLQAIAVIGLALLPLSSCTAKYQDMLRDREETIRDLEERLSTERGENARLQRDLAQAKSELATAQAAPVAREADVSKTPDQDKALTALKESMREEGVDLPVRYRNGRISIGVPNKVTFSPGSQKVSPEGRAVLARVAKVLASKYRSHKIFVEGHTDTDPIQKTKDKYLDNWHLSAMRAHSVAAFLMEKGVPDSHVVIVGYGPFDPLSPSDKALNRRVEIVVTND